MSVGVDAEDVDLGLGEVGDDAAAQDVGRTRDVDERGAQQAAGERLRRRDRLASPPEGVDHVERRDARAHASDFCSRRMTTASRTYWTAVSSVMASATAIVTWVAQRSTWLKVLSQISNGSR